MRHDCVRCREKAKVSGVHISLRIGLSVVGNFVYMDIVLGLSYVLHTFPFPNLFCRLLCDGCRGLMLLCDKTWRAEVARAQYVTQGPGIFTSFSLVLLT